MDNTQGKKLYRSTTNRVIFGVCGGLGEYFNIDPIILRIIFIALTIGAGTGAIIYIILALLIPKAPQEFESDLSKIDIKERAHGLADEIRGMKGKHSHPYRSNLFGWFIVILGLSLLLDRVTPWHAGFAIFWALLTIIIGAMILRGKRHCHCGSHCDCGPNCDCKDCNCENCDCDKYAEKKSEDISAGQNKENKHEIHNRHDHHRHGGGIFRLFIGLLFLILGFGFLIQNFNIIPGFHIYLLSLYKLWPVLIILAGLSLVSRSSRVGRVLSIIFMLAIIILILALLWPAIGVSGI
jgi:phage shock protein C